MTKQQKLSNKQVVELSAFMAHKDRIGAEVRRAAAVLYMDDEADDGTVKRFTQYSRRQAFALRKAYLDHGTDALIDHRKNNRPRVLTSQERKTVVTTLKTKQPKDVISGCSVEHWTTGLLGQYILHTTGKQYKSKTSERLLFKEARLTFHLPGRRYENTDPAARHQWEEETAPILREYWADDDVVILCEDEMVLTSRTTVQKVWLPRGTYPPVIETNSTRKRQNFYGWLNVKTGEEYAFITEQQNMGITAEILSKIRQFYPDKKLVIFWDNCGWHRGSKVIEWIEQDGNVEAIHFPPYTPELNPQEHVWKSGRKAITHNQYITKIDEAARQLKDYITSRRFGYKLLGFSCGAEL